MAESAALDDRGAFAERLRLQIASRYSGAPVEVDASAFAIRVGGLSGALLSLAPLYQACIRDPAAAPRLITSFVSSVERQLNPAAPHEMSANRLLWCVRGRRDLEHLRRASDLLTVDLGAGLVAFVAESLPGSIMRGVPRQEWEAQRLDESEARAFADRNTQQRFTGLLERIGQADRVPGDGWRMAGDPLFQGSILMLPQVLGAFSQLAEGEVLFAVPDRGLVLAIAAESPGADRFTRRVLREWREAMHPCSRDLLRSDGSSLQPVRRRGGGVGSAVMPWLQE